MKRLEITDTDGDSLNASLWSGGRVVIAVREEAGGDHAAMLLTETDARALIDFLEPVAAPKPEPEPEPAPLALTAKVGDWVKLAGVPHDEDKTAGWYEVSEVDDADADMPIRCGLYGEPGGYGWAIASDVEEVYPAAEKARNDALVQISNSLADGGGNAARADTGLSVILNDAIARAHGIGGLDTRSFVFLSDEATAALGEFRPVSKCTCGAGGDAQ